MIKKFLRGMVIGAAITSASVMLLAFFIALTKLFFMFAQELHLDPLFWSGIAYILIGSIIYGVLAVKNKV